MIEWLKQRSWSVFVLPHSALEVCFRGKWWVGTLTGQLGLRPVDTRWGRLLYCFFPHLHWIAPFFCLPLALLRAGGDNGGVCSMSEWFYTTCSAACSHNVRRLCGSRVCLMTSTDTKYVFFGGRAWIPANMRFRTNVGHLGVIMDLTLLNIMPPVWQNCIIKNSHVTAKARGSPKPLQSVLQISLQPIKKLFFISQRQFWTNWWSHIARAALLMWQK